MFPKEGDVVGEARARSFCNGCPVREECLAAALVREEPSGVWGGHTVAERWTLLRRGAVQERLL